MVKEIPLDKLLLETDAPYFLPHNATTRVHNCAFPGHVIHVAAKVAEIKKIKMEEVLKANIRNSKKMYHQFFAGRHLICLNLMTIRKRGRQKSFGKYSINSNFHVTLLIGNWGGNFYITARLPLKKMVFHLYNSPLIFYFVCIHAKHVENDKMTKKQFFSMAVWQ